MLEKIYVGLNKYNYLWITTGKVAPAFNGKQFLAGDWHSPVGREHIGFLTKRK